MRAAIEQSLFAGMQAELAREAPPREFAGLPMIPGGRYTDPDFLALER